MGRRQREGPPTLARGVGRPVPSCLPHRRAGSPGSSSRVGALGGSCEETWLERGRFITIVLLRGLKPGPGTAFLRVGWMERCAGFLSFVPCPCDSPTPAGKARFVGRKHGEPTGCLRTSLSFAPSAPLTVTPGQSLTSGSSRDCAPFLWSLGCLPGFLSIAASVSLLKASAAFPRSFPEFLAAARPLPCF